MINTDMRFYDYYLIGALDEYKQPQLPAKDAIPNGSIKMCINTISQSIAENIKYQNATYIGNTLADITDKYIIKYGDQRLKVLYINPKGRYKSVFMTEL